MHLRQMGQQMLRERRQAWADLNDKVIFAQAHRRDDCAQDTLIDQEMLTKALARLMRSATFSQAAVQRRFCRAAGATIPAPAPQSCVLESRFAQRCARGLRPSRYDAH